MKTTGVTPAWIHELRDLAYSCTNAEQIVALGSLGVTTDFVRHLKQLGIHATLAQLVAMRSVGVTPEYVATLQAQGERNLSPDDLVAPPNAESCSRDSL